MIGKNEKSEQAPAPHQPARRKPAVGRFRAIVTLAVLSTQYGKASWPFKDPDEILDFDIDWTQRLFSEEELALFNAGSDLDPDDAIATSVFSLPAGGPVAISSSYIGTATKVWLSGGAEYQTYLIQNRITKVGGRTMDQTVKLKVRSK